MDNTESSTERKMLEELARKRRRPKYKRFVRRIPDHIFNTTRQMEIVMDEILEIGEELKMKHKHSSLKPENIDSWN